MDGMDPMDYPEIGDWARKLGEGVDSVDFLTRHGRLSHWLVVAHVLWPEFVEVDGCVLWSRVYEPANLREWQARLPGRPAAVERTLNQLMLWQVIDCRDTPEDNAALAALAAVIARSWRAALAERFPDKRFDVEAVATEDGPVVTFSTRR